MNGESIVSVSQFIAKQQGLKQQQQTYHGADHEMVKQIVGISMQEDFYFCSKKCGADLCSLSMTTF
jgi:hypothetical protein